MDVRMPGIDGVAATSQIRREHPHVTVLVLTTLEDETALRAAMAAGASGYILKDTSADDVADLVRMAHRGFALFAPTMASRLATSTHSQPASATLDVLSERERDVLRALGEGLSNREIADRLCITEGTTRNHVTNILSRLGLKSRMQAALVANGVRSSQKGETISS
jgi:DNA-binding NarL/FixJ family response regulator